MFYKKGQAIITLLFFCVIAIIITTGAVTLSYVNSQGTSKLEGGTDTYYVAESGSENALIKLLRDSNYTGETMSVGPGTVTITVTGTTTKTITSVGKSGNYLRKIQVVIIYNNNNVNDAFTISSWKEIP